ncbi:GH11853 [Drosophila grimshawi]|uniref:GH11853 n=2 Tax=Drosophila grimshawi TaxID=7222 RepID=B4JLL0_DROGR|nr:GH11853 [Drosophila grimshawi]
MPALKHYPSINLNRELLNTSNTAHFNVGEIFIPVESESVLKRISRTFFESGFWKALDEARSARAREQSPLISTTADYFAHLLELYRRLKLEVFPHTQKLSAERIAQYAETRDWIHSGIRYIAWHTHLFKVAVAGVDDVVRIYSKITDKNAGIGPVLKSPTQTQITCMAWRPLCAFELVVGCHQGLCFWIIDNNMHLGRSINPSHTFKHPSNLPISSLQWNKDGTLLATASLGDRAILIWHADDGKIQPLKRLGPPSSLLSWSPDNDHLIASTVGHVFRMWECYDRWKTERWVCNSDSVQSTCWSPCGRFLLFVATKDPILYCIRLVQLHINPSKYDNEVMPIADLNACVLNDRSNTLIGGPAQQLAMDPLGKYLIVTFKSTNYIAVFRTYIGQYEFEISGGHYLSGESADEYPSYICFQPLNMDNDRSVLTIGWSGGRIQLYVLN